MKSNIERGRDATGGYRSMADGMAPPPAFGRYPPIMRTAPAINR